MPKGRGGYGGSGIVVVAGNSGFTVSSSTTLVSDTFTLSTTSTDPELLCLVNC